MWVVPEAKAPGPRAEIVFPPDGEAVGGPECPVEGLGRPVRPEADRAP